MSDQCPNHVDLERWVVAGDTSGEIARHIAACNACRKLGEEIRLNNGMIDRLRRALSSPAGPSATIDDTAAPAAVVKGYRIIREIHRGAQGIVYEALQESTKRVVALKLALRGGFADDLERVRFEREVELIARLEHPNIVSIYDSGVSESGRPFLAMQYIDGLPLDEYWIERARASANDGRAMLLGKLRMMNVISTAVDHAHVHGVIHRDLKPSNILVDAQGRPHVLDFGLAKLAPEAFGQDRAATVTTPGSFLGTLAFAAPEQAVGDPGLIDTRTDVYALGAILYLLLTGTPPHDTAAPIGEVIRQITDATPPMPSERALSHASRKPKPGRTQIPIDADLDTVTLKALARDKDRRYQSARDLARDIDHYLAGRPIDARRDSRWYVIRKSVRRHKAAVAGSVSFLVLLLAFSIVMAVMYRRADREARKAQAINLFLQDTLASVKPIAPDKETTVREVLDEAVQWVEIALENEPEIEASLRTTIGNSYRALGRYEAAEAQLVRARKLRESLLGTAHPDVAQSINALALLDLDRERFADAERKFNEALAIRRQRLGPANYDVSITLQNLGYLYRRTARLDEAEQAFREALTIREAILGYDHPDTAMVLYNLAGIMLDRNDIDLAESLHRQVLAIREKALPATHPDLARSHLALGKLLLEHRNRPGDAEPHLRAAMNTWSESGLDRSDEYFDAVSTLGRCLIAQNRFDEAEPILLESFHRMQSLLPPDDARLAQAQAQIAYMYETWGRPEQASAYRRSGDPPG